MKSRVMTSLKVYVDLMSQPSRAVALFVKLNKIPHDLKLVQIKKGEHLDTEYISKVNRFGKVPGIIHGDHNIIESIAILRYLAREFETADHWYPKDRKLQAKVDEFLEWHHIGLRVPLSMFFQSKFIIPMMSGQPPNEKQVSVWKKRMEIAFDDLESVWLKTNPYLSGSKISIADLIGLCEVDQPRIAGYDCTTGRPKVAAWIDRVRNDIQPHYDEVTKVINMVIKKYKGIPPTSISKL